MHERMNVQICHISDRFQLHPTWVLFHWRSWAHFHWSLPWHDEGPRRLVPDDPHGVSLTENEKKNVGFGFNWSGLWVGGIGWFSNEFQAKIYHGVKIFRLLNVASWKARIRRDSSSTCHRKLYIILLKLQSQNCVRVYILGVAIVHNGHFRSHLKENSIVI